MNSHFNGRSTAAEFVVMKDKMKKKKKYLLAIAVFAFLYLFSFSCFYFTSRPFSLAYKKPDNDLIIFSNSTNIHIALKVFYYPLVYLVSSQKYCPNKQRHEALMKWGNVPIKIEEIQNEKDPSDSAKASPDDQ